MIRLSESTAGSCIAISAIAPKFHIRFGTCDLVPEFDDADLFHHAAECEINNTKDIKEDLCLKRLILYMIISIMRIKHL